MVVGGPEGGKPPTIRDVARVAGVSKSAVARVLGGEGSVSPAMRQRVTAAAEDLGYRTNDLGRILATQRTMVIGLIIADITNSFYSVLADGVIKVAQRAGYRIMVLASNEEAGAERQSIELLCASRVAGIIAVPTGANAELWRDAVRLVKQVVFIDRSVDGVDGVHVIQADSAGGAHAAVAHLAALGHTRIGALVGPLQVSTASERLTGYRTALAEAGIPYDPNLVVSASYRRPHAEQAALELLAREPTPTAVFASNNIHGEAMLMAARDSGLAIPAQLSLVMFDDLPWARLLAPPPTVVSQPTERLGREAAAKVLRAISGEDTSPGGLTSMPTRLIVRSSTAPPSTGGVDVPARTSQQESAS